MTTRTADPIAEVLISIDALLERSEALAADIAKLRQELADVAAELKLREALLTLAAEGKNETERKAQLALAPSGDADYRRTAERERELRQQLAETEARLWATRQRVHVCLALLRLAAEAEASADAPEDEEAVP